MFGAYVANKDQKVVVELSGKHLQCNLPQCRSKTS